MACANCTTYPVPGVGQPTSPIPIKDGFPLSSACDRNTVMGSIPEIIRFPNFTLVARGTVTNLVSNGGILNQANFFKVREGCYEDMNARLPGCC